MCGQLLAPERQPARGTPHMYFLDAQKSEVWSPKQDILHFPHRSLQWELMLNCAEAPNPAVCMCRQYVCLYVWGDREIARRARDTHRNSVRLNNCRCHRGQKRASDFLELELWEVVWTKVVSSGRATSSS